MNPLVTVASSTIVLVGNSSGIWSPSHPHLYPAPVQATIPIPGVVAPVPVPEIQYVPDLRLTDDYGNQLIQ